MDLNAGRIIQGEKTIEEVGEEAFRLMLDDLSGKMTKNEAVSLRVLEKICRELDCDFGDIIHYVKDEEA